MFPEELAPEAIRYNIIDVSTIVIYLVLSFGIGILAAKILRSGTKGEEGYFLAGRKMPGWMTGISQAVTSMNADVAPAYCGVAVVVGLPVAWFYMSRFGFSLLVAGLLFAVLWKRLRISTGPEFYALRFAGRGGTFVRIWTSIHQVFLGMVPWVGAGMLGVHMIFSPIFGIEHIHTTLLIILPVLLVYIWISGFSGVLVTDVIQTVVMVIANVLLCILVLAHYGGPFGLADAIRNTEGLPTGEVLSVFPVAGHEVMGPALVLLWFLIPTIGAGGGQATEGQRIFSTRSEREASKVYIWGQVALFLMLLTLTLPVLGLLPLYPELYHAQPGEREQAYGLLLQHFLPVGVLGIALAALVASVMSTIDSHSNYGAQTLTNDVWRPSRRFFVGIDGPRAHGLLALIGFVLAAGMFAFLRFSTGIATFEAISWAALGFLVVYFGLLYLFRHTREEQAVFVGRIFTVVVMLAAVAVVYSAGSLFGIAVRLAGILGATATLGWAQWWWWRVNFPSWVAAMIGGPIIYFLLGPALAAVIPGWVEYRDSSETAAQYLGMIQALAGMIVSTFFWVTVALLTKPVSMDRLIVFYQRARPMGAWGPVRRAVMELEGDKPLHHSPPGMIIGGFGTVTVGASWVSLAVLAVSQFYVGEILVGSLLAVASILVALAFKRLYNWHFDRISDPVGEKLADSAGK
ncbi:MAG: sodium:solute symporter [Candidatus Sumerlaeia bacterium]|nr:sodium:solute symporter [Candidatus Sumerlaeia bacterium]